jgi:hypothetical protein
LDVKAVTNRRRAAPARKIIPDLGIEQSPEVEGAPVGHEVVVVNYDGRSVNLAVDGKTVWLSQKRLAELFVRPSTRSITMF